MQLFQSWKDSLKVFVPHNFKLLGLVSFNAIRQAFPVWMRLFWPLFLLSFVADITSIVIVQVGRSQLSLSCVMSVISKCLLLITLFVALRPSVKRKTFSYFLDYRRHAAIFGLIFFVKLFVFRAITHVGPSSSDVFVLMLFSPFYIVLISLFMLFYLDSNGSFVDLIRAWWRMLIMAWYGLPFVLLFSLGLSVIYGVFFYLLGFGLMPVVTFFEYFPTGVGLIVYALAKLLFIILSVIPFAFVTTYYTKKLHDSFKLYFS